MYKSRDIWIFATTHPLCCHSEIIPTLHRSWSVPPRPISEGTYVTHNDHQDVSLFNEHRNYHTASSFTFVGPSQHFIHPQQNSWQWWNSCPKYLVTLYIYHDEMSFMVVMLVDTAFLERSIIVWWTTTARATSLYSLRSRIFKLHWSAALEADIESSADEEISWRQSGEVGR